MFCFQPKSKRLRKFQKKSFHTKQLGRTVFLCLNLAEGCLLIISGLAKVYHSKEYNFYIRLKDVVHYAFKQKRPESFKRHGWFLQKYFLWWRECEILVHRLSLVLLSVRFESPMELLSLPSCKILLRYFSCSRCQIFSDNHLRPIRYHMKVCTLNSLSETSKTYQYWLSLLIGWHIFQRRIPLQRVRQGFKAFLMFHMCL